MIPILLSFPAFFYIATYFALLFGLYRSKSIHTVASPFISVIVAARNEERHLPGLLDCLFRQEYSGYEVIIVDDRSSDKTADIVRSRLSQYPHLKLISVTATDPDMPAKKSALTKGIQASKGEVLLFTDADCLPPPTWIKEMSAGFEEKVGVVAGYSPYRPSAFGIKARSLWEKCLFSFIQYEELKISLWAAGSIGIRKAWLCTGRNLAYRRKVWDDIGGFQRIKHSISGDDDLFLQLVQRTTAWQIRYIASTDSHVPTKPPESFSEFVDQRTRHFSAGKFFPASLKLFSVFFYGLNFVLYFGLAASFLSPSFAWGLPLFSIKFAVDMFFIVLGSRQFGISPPFFSFPFMEAAILFYNMIFGLLGVLGTFRWKSELK
ncbi:MAG: glycosyltransferase [Bacteroidota bacterium]